MSAISTILTRLRAAIWAIDVRDDIANAIEQCYSDVSNPTLQTEALEAALQNKIDQGKMAALTIGDGTITGAKLANGTIPKAKLDPSITFDADAALDPTSTNAIQNKVVASELATVKADLENLEPLSESTKAALLACFEHVAWIDEHGQDYYDALEAALYADTIDHITAVLSLGNHQVIMGDDIDSLRDYITVTVYYQDETHETTTNYELSGDIATEGTKTITVAVGRKSTTFTCPVTWGYRLVYGKDLFVGGLRYQYSIWDTDLHYNDTSNTVRMSNRVFLPWDTGYDCYVEADTNLSVVASVNVYNQNAMNAVSNNQDITAADCGLPGWASSNPSLSVIPNTVNNSPTKTIRVTFKQVPTEVVFNANDITEVRITRMAK